MADKANVHTGRCLCAGVSYRITGPLREIVACHCNQCTRTSGNFVAATSVSASDLNFAAQDTLCWYRSSDAAERGFCRRCGSNLFWRALREDTISIMAGTLDPPTNLKIARHIFVASKSDFYEITDAAPQRDEW
jgi:hypothetical protein